MASAPPEAQVDIGRVLSRGFAAMRANFAPFLAVSMLLAGLPTFALQYWTLSSLGVPDPIADLGSFWFVTGVSALVNLLSITLLQGALTRSTIFHLSGRDADVGASALLALRLLPALIGLSLVLGLIITFGLLLLVFPGVMIYCATVVAVPALIEERRGIGGSIERSRDLTRGSRWRVFLLVVLFWVFSTIVQAIVGVFSGAAFVQPGTAINALAGGIAAGVGAAVSTMIVAVLTAALYVELREVKEGTSAAELADVFA